MRQCLAAAPPALGMRPGSLDWQSPLFGCAAALGYRKGGIPLIRARSNGDFTSLLQTRRKDE
eukprot:1104025-Pyramimonas_sp.AAC.1